MLEGLKNHRTKVKNEFQYRLLVEKYPWQGITWVIDLLPRYPQVARDVIFNYILAHWQVLPDFAWTGLEHASAIIEKRYIKWQQAESVFEEIDPLAFERLIGVLYLHLGFDIEFSSRSFDGGIDVTAHSDRSGKKELILIQCKRYLNKKIGSPEMRDLMGAVASAKATRGIIVTTSQATAPAR